MSTLKVFLMGCVAIVATNFSLESFAGTVVTTDGSDKGFYVVRERNEEGATVSARIVSPMGTANAAVVSTGEKVAIDKREFLLSDIWNVGVSGETRIQGKGYGDDTPLSGDSGEMLRIVFGGCATRSVSSSDAFGSSWKESACGIFLKMFWEEKDTLEKEVLKSGIALVFRNGDSVSHLAQNYPEDYPPTAPPWDWGHDKVIYPEQRAFLVYGPKLVEMKDIQPFESMVRVFLAFNATCRGGGESDATPENDLLQCVVLMSLETGTDHAVAPIAILSERTTWGDRLSNFAKMPWNWSFGYDGRRGIFLNAFFPNFILKVSADCLLSLYCSPVARFEKTATTVPK